MKELSLPPVKIHRSVLAEDAIKAAIADWKRKREKKANQRNSPRNQARAYLCQNLGESIPSQD